MLVSLVAATSPLPSGNTASGASSLTAAAGAVSSDTVSTTGAASTCTVFALILSSCATAAALSFLRQLMDSFAANNIIIASGSNTQTIRMITHLTADSNRLVLASSPYINCAMYLIGPTSASNCLVFASSVYFCDTSSSSVVLATFIFAFSSDICVSTSESIPTVNEFRNSLIRF